MEGAEKAVEIHISLNQEFDFIRTKNLEEILSIFRKAIHKIQPYRTDPLIIESIEIEYGTSQIEMNVSLKVPKGLEVDEFLEENIVKPSKKQAEKTIHEWENIQKIQANFTVEGETGEELSWTVK